MIPDFDADIRLEPVGDGAWRGRVQRHWYIVDGANGGLLAAQATRALELAAPAADQAPRSLTLHFLRTPDEGDVDWSARVERAGRSTTFVSLKATRGDAVLAVGLGALNAPREGQLEWQDAKPPAVRPPDQLRRIEFRAGMAEVVRNYDYRFALGSPPMSGGEHARVGGWIRTIAPRPLDAAALAAYADAWYPAAGGRTAGPGSFPTLDLTVHWRAPVPAGEHPWVLGRFWSERSWGGTWEENGELYAEDGTLLVQSRQLALIRYPLR